MKSKLRGRTLAIAASLAALACAGTARADITVGFSGVMSGPQASSGQDQYDGFMLAVQQLDGKLGGQKAVVIREDDQLKPDVGTQIIQKFVERDKVDAIVGLGYSNVLMAELRRLKEAGVPALATNAGPEPLAGKQCAANIFELAWQNDAFSEAMGQYARDKGYKKVAILAPNYQAGKDKLTGFKRYYKDPVLSETYTPLDQLDFSTEIAAIQASHADAVFAFYPGALGVNFARQLYQAGLMGKIGFLSDSLIEANSVAALKEQAVGAIFGSHWSPNLDNAQNKQFVAAYEAKYKRMPSEYSADAYDAAYLLDAAVRKLGGNVKDKAAFVAAIKDMGSTFPSVRGSFAFNNNNMPILNYYAFQVVNEGGKIGYQQLADVLPDHKDVYASACPLK